MRKKTSRSKFDECEKWLFDSLINLRQGVVGERIGSDFEPLGNVTTDRLIDAICSGDLDSAEAVYKADLTGNENKEFRLHQRILSIVHKIEGDWLSDRLDFTTTVFIFWNVQRFLNRIKKRQIENQNSYGNDAPSLVIAASPGTQHNFGVMVLSDFFEIDGWRVKTLQDGKEDLIFDAVQERRVDVLGLSVGHDAALQYLSEHIVRARSLSRNPNLRVILGGNIFSEPKKQYDWLGADFVALSAEEAVLYCREIVKKTKISH